MTGISQPLPASVFYSSIPLTCCVAMESSFPPWASVSLSVEWGLRYLKAPSKGILEEGLFHRPLVGGDISLLRKGR